MAIAPTHGRISRHARGVLGRYRLRYPPIELDRRGRMVQWLIRRYHRTWAISAVRFMLSRPGECRLNRILMLVNIGYRISDLIRLA